MVGTSNKPVPEMAIEYWNLPNKKKPCRTDIQVIGSFFFGPRHNIQTRDLAENYGVPSEPLGPDFGSPIMWVKQCHNQPYIQALYHKMMVNLGMVGPIALLTWKSHLFKWIW